MSKQEEYTKCECGGQFEYDGYDNIEIVDGFLVIKGDCKCNECGKEGTYEELHILDFNNPFDVEIDYVEEL